MSPHKTSVSTYDTHRLAGGLADNRACRLMGGLGGLASEQSGCLVGRSADLRTNEWTSGRVGLHEDRKSFVMTDVRASGLNSLLAGGRNVGRRVDKWAGGRTSGRVGVWYKIERTCRLGMDRQTVALTLTLKLTLYMPVELPVHLFVMTIITFVPFVFICAIFTHKLPNVIDLNR